jgi:beta-lactamase regulating signal transducer with metallopeptidase domain
MNLLLSTYNSGSLASFVVMLLTLVTLSSALCHLLVPVVLRLARPLRPEPRALLLLVACLAPWLFAFGVASCALSDVAFGSCDMTDRCLWSISPDPISKISLLTSGFALFATLAVAVRVWFQHREARRALELLERASAHENQSKDVEEQIRIVPGGEPLAFSGCGKIYVAQILREHLLPAEYRALLLHEEAHIRRHDGLLLILARLASATYLPPLRHHLLAQLTLAAEESCDQSAAGMSSPHIVAAAILKVERLLQQRSNVLATAFAEGFVASRIDRLLNADPRAARFGWVQLALLASIPAAVFLADVMYYASMYVLYPYVM